MSRVCTTNLSADDKRILFEGIKIKRPELAKLMAEDAFIQGLKNRFGAGFVFERTEYQALYNTGLDAIHKKQEAA